MVDVVSLRGVNASFGIPESARRKQRGVELDAIFTIDFECAYGRESGKFLRLKLKTENVADL